jgi:hypothetical protein
LVLKSPLILRSPAGNFEKCRYSLKREEFEEMDGREENLWNFSIGMYKDSELVGWWAGELVGWWAGGIVGWWTSETVRQWDRGKVG